MKLVLTASISFFIYWIFMFICIKFNEEKYIVQSEIEKLNQKNISNKKTEKKNRELKSLKLIHVSFSMREEILMSGVKVKPEEFVLIWILMSLGPSFLIYSLTSNLIRSLILFTLGLIIPPMYIKKQTKKRKVKFEQQLGDALLILSNGLRAGFSFTQALDNISKDLADPIKTEFSQISREAKLGLDIEISLNKVADKMESADMRLLTTAVSVQRQVGGNLSEIIDTIAETIRERQEIQRTVKTLTSQGRISGKIIGLLPIALLLIITFINPVYMEPMFNTSYGYTLIGISVFLEVLGFIVIAKIVNIKF